jgi:Zn-dependent protease with chaperone function
MNRWTSTVAAMGLAAAWALAPAAAQGLEKTSRQGEIEAGRAAAREVESEIPLSTNAAYRERVQRIGAALVDALPDKAYPYEFKVLATPEFNAFCLPGGFMYVNEGLLARLPDDDEVAFVMGHEITHAWHRHAVQQSKKGQGFAALAILAGVATKSADVAGLVHALLSQKYSRSEETDADETGMDLMWRAGFDPQGALEATRVMAKLDESDHTPAYLRSHPAGKDRLNNLQKRVGDLEKRVRPPLTLPKGAETLPAEGEGASLPPLPPGVPVETPWYPLAVGDSWTYAVGEGPDAAAYTVRVTGRISVAAGSAYRMETVIGGGAPVSYRLIALDTGAWRLNGAADTEWRREYAFAAPPDPESSTEEGDFTVLPAESISTPCGVFPDTLKVRRVKDGKTCDMWFARGVGLVRRVWAESGLSETLRSYHLASEPAPDVPAPAPVP